MNFHTRPGAPRARPRAMKPIVAARPSLFFRSDDYDSREQTPAPPKNARTATSRIDPFGFPRSTYLFLFFLFLYDSKRTALASDLMIKCAKAQNMYAN